MTTPNPLGADLSGLAAGLGVDPNALDLSAPAAAGTNTAATASGVTAARSKIMVRMGPDRPLNADEWAALPSFKDSPSYAGLSDEAKKAIEGSETALGREHSQAMRTPDVLDYTAAINDILHWTDDQLGSFKDALVSAGRIDADAGRRELEQAWASMVDDAARWQAAGSDLTPWDMVTKYAGYDALTGNPKRPTARTVTQRQVQMTDPDQARRVLNDALSGSLGRRASDGELDDFQAALNNAAAANPVVTTQAYNTDAAGNTTIDSTATGGVDVSGFADKYSQSGQNSDEYKHYQAATTYMNALTQALQDPFS